MSNKVKQLQKETVLWGKRVEKKHEMEEWGERKRYCQWNTNKDSSSRKTVTILMINTVEK